MNEPAVSGWLGRVFLRDLQGGNPTAVVWGVAPDAGPALAERFDVPDLAVVTDIESRRVTLRTFSPFEELQQCYQTALAAPFALDRADGHPLEVVHPFGERLLVSATGNHASAELIDPAPPALARQIDNLDEDWSLGRRAAYIYGRSRRRIFLRFEDLEDVEAASVEPAAVRSICRRHDVSGVVLFCLSAAQLRCRVFTTSLKGAEDVGTGGAVHALAELLAAEGLRGEVQIQQGPPRGQQAWFTVDITQRIRLSSTVCGLIAGRILGPPAGFDTDLRSSPIG